MENVNMEKSATVGSSYIDYKSFKFLHAIAGVLLLYVIYSAPIVINVFTGPIFGRYEWEFYVVQGVAAIVTGFIIGYWARCVPVITLIVIVLLAPDTPIVKLLFKGIEAAFGYAYQSINLIYYVLTVVFLFIFAYLGAKVKRMINSKSIVSA